VNQSLKNKILRRDSFTCRFCGQEGGELTIDHIIPRARGGHYYKKANLVTACRKCNQIKANRTPEEAGMTIISDGFDYTPPGRLDELYDEATELIVVRPSRRKKKKQDRYERKALLKKMGF